MSHLRLARAPRPPTGWERVTDAAMAGALIVLTLPLMAIVALAIKCDSRGPIFAREEREGAQGSRFAALKFRTESGDGGETRVGWFLQFTRVDNLPQLVNVLRGEMTCVRGAPDLPFFLD